MKVPAPLPPTVAAPAPVLSTVSKVATPAPTPVAAPTAGGKGPLTNPFAASVEQDYRRWVKSLPPSHRNDIDPKTGNAPDYDYRRAFADGVASGANGHFTDRYKLPTHRTFSNESLYFNPANRDQAGEWKETKDGGNRWVPFNPAVKSEFVEDKDGNPVAAPSPTPYPSTSPLLVAPPQHSTAADDIPWLRNVVAPSEKAAGSRPTSSAHANHPAADPQKFYQTMEDVRAEAEQNLRTYYGHNNVTVSIGERARNLDRQARLMRSGASRTELGLHNVSMAADFLINVNGKPTWDQEPFRVLGASARKRDLFWGWDWDAGHVGEHRTVADALRLHPELKDAEAVRAFADKYKSGDVPAKYRKILSVLDSLDGTPRPRTYIGGKGNTTTEDKLLEPIYVNTPQGKPVASR